MLGRPCLLVDNKTGNGDACEEAEWLRKPHSHEGSWDAPFFLPVESLGSIAPLQIHVQMEKLRLREGKSWLGDI